MVRPAKRSSLRLYKPGTNIAADECIVRFTGRSKQKVTIPNKPTPTGFNIWVVAKAGYFLGWLWHSPKHSFDYVEGQEPAASRERQSLAAESIRINPTQAVVVSLVKTLPKSTYHVFLDNLFFFSEPIPCSPPAEYRCHRHCANKLWLL